LRASFLDQSCAGDESLRLEVESLLASDEQASDFLNTPAMKIATEEIAEERALSLVGRQLGHYRLLSQLGAGGMGEVYLAARADDQYRKQVAIKLVKRRHTLGFEAECRRSHIQAGLRRQIAHEAEIFLRTKTPGFSTRHVKMRNNKTVSHFAQFKTRTHSAAETGKPGD